MYLTLNEAAARLRVCAKFLATNSSTFGSRGFARVGRHA